MDDMAIRILKEIKEEIAKQKLEQHPCKWNGAIGRFEEFCRITDKTLTKNANEIEEIKEEISQLKSILSDIKAQKSYLVELKRDQTIWLGGIAATILTFFITWLIKTIMGGI